MDRLTSMRAFVKVVDSGGFSAAARAMDLSPAMVTKHIAALESQLGVALLSRTTRQVSPTQAGQRFHAHCQEILDAVEAAEREVGEQAHEPVGCLRVTAPVEFGALHVAPLVPTLLARHPRLTVHLEFTNRVVDLMEEGYDAAVRVTPSLDTRLRGRQLTSSRLVLVASPMYLQAHGEPLTPQELARQHPTLCFSLSMGREWPFMVEGAAPKVLPVQPRLQSSSSDALRVAALAGAGIALLPTFLVSGDLVTGRLRRVLPHAAHGALKIFVVHPHRRSLPARVLVFMDALAQHFGSAPERDGFLAE